MAHIFDDKGANRSVDNNSDNKNDSDSNSDNDNDSISFDNSESDVDSNDDNNSDGRPRCGVKDRRDSTYTQLSKRDNQRALTMASKNDQGMLTTTAGTWCFW